MAEDDENAKKDADQDAGRQVVSRQVVSRQVVSRAPRGGAGGVLWAGVGVGVALGATVGFAVGLLRLGVGFGLVLGAVVGWAMQTAVAERDR